MREAIALRADHTGDELRKLARASDDANQTRRLLALASIYDDGSRSAFASSRRGRATMHKTRTPLRILKACPRLERGNFAGEVAKIRNAIPDGTPVEIWFQE